MKYASIHFGWFLIWLLTVVLLYTPLGNEFCFMVGMLILEAKRQWWCELIYQMLVLGLNVLIVSPLLTVN